MQHKELTKQSLKRKKKMYLISIYFDETTDHKIRSYMKQIAKHTDNTAMLEGNVPPHITISAFRCNSEVLARACFERITRKVFAGELQWVSVGAFLPQVLYLSPVLNEYLQKISETIYKEVTQEEEIFLSGNYRPYAWMPHATLAKQLTKEQMKNAFEVMQNQFGPFRSKVIKIGLAKTNPYTDLEIFELKEKRSIEKIDSTLQE